MKAAHIIVKGFVQGVGYRKFIRDKARKLGLVGWVRNLPDGSVEALIFGEQSSVEKVVLECKTGPFLSDVKEVNVIWEDPKEELTDFLIRHDF